MTSHYDKFKAAKARVESTQKSKRTDRVGKKMERAAWHESEAVINQPSNEKYREGWDRIFGKRETNGA